MDINLKTAAYIVANKEEINHIVECFKSISSKVISNTFIQINNFDLIERFIDLSDYVYNNDITETSLNKIKSLLDDTNIYLSSQKYKECNEILKKIAEYNTKLIKENGTN